MNVYDIIIAITAVLAIILGWRKGIITQIFTLAAILLGVWAAFRFGNKVGEWIGKDGMSGTVSFVLMFVVAVLLVLLVGWIADKTVDSVGLGVFNRLGGALIALVINLLVLNLAFNLFFNIDRNFGNANPKKIESSVLLAPLQKFSQTVMPYIVQAKDWAVDNTHQLWESPDQNDNEQDSEQQKEQFI